MVAWWQLVLLAIELAGAFAALPVFALGMLSIASVVFAVRWIVCPAILFVRTGGFTHAIDLRTERVPAAEQEAMLNVGDALKPYGGTDVIGCPVCLEAISPVAADGGGTSEAPAGEDGVQLTCGHAYHR